MSDERKKAVSWIVALLVGMLLIGYPLSVGPMALATDRGFVSERFYEAVYGPLMWACGLTEVTEQALYVYVVIIWVGHE
jgi:hypothetical protein